MGACFDCLLSVYLCWLFALVSGLLVVCGFVFGICFTVVCLVLKCLRCWLVLVGWFADLVLTCCLLWFLVVGSILFYWLFDFGVVVMMCLLVFVIVFD